MERRKVMSIILSEFLLLCDQVREVVPKGYDYVRGKYRWHIAFCPHGRYICMEGSWLHKGSLLPDSTFDFFEEPELTLMHIGVSISPVRCITCCEWINLRLSEVPVPENF